MHVEALKNHTLAHGSCPLNEPRLSVVTALIAKLDDEVLGIALSTMPTMRRPQLSH